MSEVQKAIIKNCHLKVVERVSNKGKKYRAVVAVVNGKDVDIGFCNVYTELALARCGVVVDK